VNLAELKARIIADELPASETARLIDEMLECPHFNDGTCERLDCCQDREHDTL